MFFSILKHYKCLSYLFPLHFNAYVMGLQPLYIFFTLSVWIVCASKHYFAYPEINLISYILGF